MKTLIKNGRVVTAVDDYHADIFIDGETVTTIGKTLDYGGGCCTGRVGQAGDSRRDGSIRVTNMELPFGGTSSEDDFLRMQ